jgi:formyltetrahydrofolate synthetase
VLVATVRALKHHAGLEDDPRVDSASALAAVETGAANLRRHLGIVKTFGLPCVVAVNRRPGDTDEEVELVKRLAMEAGAFGAEVNDGFSNGGEGAAELAQAVADACEQPNEFQLIYEDDDSIEEKIRKVGSAKRPRGLQAARARHPRVHGSRMARAAGRRHPADARTGQGAGRAERRHRRGR